MANRLVPNSLNCEKDDALKSKDQQKLGVFLRAWEGITEAFKCEGIGVCWKMVKGGKGVNEVPPDRWNWKKLTFSVVEGREKRDGHKAEGHVGMVTRVGEILLALSTALCERKDESGRWGGETQR